MHWIDAFRTAVPLLTDRHAERAVTACCEWSAFLLSQCLAVAEAPSHWAARASNDRFPFNFALCETFRRGCGPCSFFAGITRGNFGSGKNLHVVRLASYEPAVALHLVS